MSVTASIEALSQASSLSKLLNNLLDLGKDPELVIWRLAAQHLLSSMLSFAFRVYSQQKLAANQSKQWTEIHAAVIGALLSGSADLEIDPLGRLIVIDKTSVSIPRDLDGDSFQETLVLSPVDAAQIIREEKPAIYSHIISRIGDWSLLPCKREISQPKETPLKPLEKAEPQKSIVQPLTNTVEPSNPGTPQEFEDVPDEVIAPEPINRACPESMCFEKQVLELEKAASKHHNM